MVFNRYFHNTAISLFLCILMFTALSCATNPVTGKSELMLVSESQELKIGRDAAPSMKWDFGGHYRDKDLESYLGDIVNRLWAISERSHLPVQFYIQNTSVPNAFALPGYVAITRGLLSDMENEAQFAAVMGHEIGQEVPQVSFALFCLSAHPESPPPGKADRHHQKRSNNQE